MKTVTTKAMAKVAAVATGLAMATSMLSFAPMVHAAALTSNQVQSILSLLSSFGADSATIASVNAALTGTAVTSGSTTTTTGSSASCSFSRSLTIGSTGADVTCLQQALIAGGFSIPAGATGYFGTQTRAAVASWQSSRNVAPAVGYFGPISRAAWNLGGGSSTTTTTTTTTTVAGCVAGAMFSSTTG
ncbi:MAG: peptidoglycan-binding protein, partial [bacterium]|nr:peptidoglycan-binding protein [bacterium]